MIKTKEINDKNNIISQEENNSDPGDYLNFIKINGINKIEEIDTEVYIQQCIIFSNTLAQENETNIGQEINKFFDLILSENKEGEPLKVNFAISKKYYDKEKTINKQLDIILNKKIGNELVLTEEISENIAIILAIIYQKIQNNYNKFNNFDEFSQKANNYCIFYNRDILRDYLITEEEIKKREKILNTPINEDFVIINRINSPSKKRSNSGHNNIKFSTIAQQSKLLKKKKVYYEFRETKEDKNLEFPIELMILKRKFQTVKKLRLVISNHNSKGKNIFDSSSFNDKETSYRNMSFSSNKSETNFKKKDVDNIIFILLNLNWLFPHLIEIDIDLSNDNIIRDQMSIYKSGPKYFSKILKRSPKQTNYSSNFKKVNHNHMEESIFQNYFQSTDNEDQNSYESNETFSLEFKSFQEEENNINLYDNNIEENKYHDFDKFIKKYRATFEMIIIYAFFMTKIPKLLICNFTLPFNYETEILRMLKINDIILPDFNLLSFLSDANMIQITIDFNSLDNKVFQEVLSLLYKNNKLNVCQLNFFPSDNYFVPELLFKFLQDNNQKYNLSVLNKIDKINLQKIEPYDDIDIFLLKLLSEYFEANINKLFQNLCIKSTVSQLSLIFDVPTLLSKIDYYLMIILKFILNIFIAIDNIKLNLTSLNLQTSNFFFDNNKYPFLEDFLDKLCIHSNTELRLLKLTCQMKFINITNIYRIIPYNIEYLCLGDFDFPTFSHFTEYITSSEFSKHSKLIRLKISLSNSLLNIDECYHYLLKLLTEHPKRLKDIGINTHFIININQLNKLLKITDYNTLENIYMIFDIKSLKGNGYETINKEIFSESKEFILNNNNYMKLFCTERTYKSKNYIMNNIMYNLGLKYNKKFMDYNIFKSLEKFRCTNTNKNYIIQFA